MSTRSEFVFLVKLIVRDLHHLYGEFLHMIFRQVDKFTDYIIYQRKWYNLGYFIDRHIQVKLYWKYRKHQDVAVVDKRWVKLHGIMVGAIPDTDEGLELLTEFERRLGRKL